MRYRKFLKQAADVGAGGGGTPAPAPATATATATGTAALEELRAENRALAAKLAQLDGIDVAAIKQLSAKFASDEEKKLLEKGGVDAVVESRLGALNAEFKKKEKAYSEKLSKLSSAQLTSALTQAAIKSGVLPAAIDDVIYRAKAAGWCIDDSGEINAGGMRGKDGKALSVEEWIDSLKATAPHFYNTPQGGGGIGSAGGGGGVAGIPGNLAGNKNERLAAIKKMFPELK